VANVIACIRSLGLLPLPSSFLTTSVVVAHHSSTWCVNHIRYETYQVASKACVADPWLVREKSKAKTAMLRAHNEKNVTSVEHMVSAVTNDAHQSIIHCSPNYPPLALSQLEIVFYSLSTLLDIFGGGIGCYFWPFGRHLGPPFHPGLLLECVNSARAS
jgi:hypothetical protein